MKKGLILGITLIILIFSVSAVSAGLFGSNSNDDNSNIVSNEAQDRYIDVYCDADFKGKLRIVEFSDATPNDDGSYNASFFFNKNGDPKGGNTHDITIEDGMGMYSLEDNTKFFIISDSFDDFKMKKKDIEDDTTIDVKFYNGTDDVLTSSLKPDEFGCDVSFGGNIYSNTGASVNINDNLK